MYGRWCRIKRHIVHIVAAAQEERFTRKKHDHRFPSHAIRYCLQEGQVALRDVNYVAFYEKPLVKFERLIETYLSFAPRGLLSFWQAIPVWLKEKLFLKEVLKKERSKALMSGSQSTLSSSTVTQTQASKQVI